MMVIEVTEDKFGNIMKDIACIEDKIIAIKELFENDAMGQRKHSYPYQDEYYDGKYDRYAERSHKPREYSRYM